MFTFLRGAANIGPLGQILPRPGKQKGQAISDRQALEDGQGMKENGKIILMATPRLSHDDREKAVLADLELSFPEFAGQSLAWTKVPDGQDPPDFISQAPQGAIGLELVEWLDGEQMTPAKFREAQRERIHRVLAHRWEDEYQPKHYRGAFLSPRMDEGIARTDEAQLRKEFFAFAADVDRDWLANTERWGRSDYRTEFPDYPLLMRYVSAINFVDGTPHGLCWFDSGGDGGAFDPNVTVETLKSALDKKLASYSTPDRQAHLKMHPLRELDLLVHGGSNIAIYNTPSGRLSLEQIARQGAEYYAGHPHRNLFDRVWFFHSIDAADEWNQPLGFAPGEGRVRWLAQLWPTFSVHPGSIG